MRGRSPAVAVVGATATGKTALAESLARALDAEIVCCDSRQVFGALEIGTGKPTPAERAAWPHHLFEALELGHHASAGWYARVAAEACAAIRTRGRIPLLVGGSGLYLRAFLSGLAPTPPHDPAVRARLRAELAAVGPEALHARLRSVDAASAERIGVRDAQRITRGLEVHEVTGHPLSAWHAHTPEPGAEHDARLIEVVVAPAPLRERIAARTRAMFAPGGDTKGLIEETRALLDHGAGEALRGLRAIGYDEAIGVLDGSLDPASAATRVDLRTAQLAKRQRTWFRHQVDAPRIEATGLDTGRLAAAALDLLRRA